MALKHRVVPGKVVGYNCAMATMDRLYWKGEGQAYCLAIEPEYLKEHQEEIIKDFVHNLRISAKCANESTLYGGYDKIPFYVFHDNVKDEHNVRGPLTDMSALMCHLYENQEKYGVHVTRTPMADNHYHPPTGSHPGRVYVLSPGKLTVYKKGVKVSEEEKKGMRSCLSGYRKSMNKEDIEVLESLSKI